MQKILLTMMALALTIAAQSAKIDSTQFVAFYNYSIQTQDEEGEDVTDSIRLALLVGTRATYCTTVLSYNKDGRASQEMQNAFIMHHQNVRMMPENREKSCIRPLLAIVSVEPNRQYRELIARILRILLVVHNVAKAPPVFMRRENRPQNIQRLLFHTHQRTHRHIVLLLFIEGARLECKSKKE